MNNQCKLMDFSDSLIILKEGKETTRMDLADVIERIFIEDDTFYAKEIGTNLIRKWEPEHDDILAEDWVEVPKEEEFLN